jgi:hypothetical protein
MKENNMRKELKIGLVLIMIFNLTNGLLRGVIGENMFLEFISGGLCGGGLLGIILGIIPDTAYLKIRRLKGKSVR